MVGRAFHRGQVLFVDAQVGGVAGDMLVAGFLDLGVPLAALRRAVSGLGADFADSVALGAAATERSAIACPRFVVRERAGVRPPFRDYRDVKRLLAAGNLEPGALALAQKAFQLLAEAEAVVRPWRPSGRDVRGGGRGPAD